MTSEITLACRLAREAGAILLGYFGRGLAVDLKDGDEPVTQADRAANEWIVTRLQREFPDDAVLSEELPDDGSRHSKARVWMVDPMDGTRDFIRGETGFSVMIGLIESARPMLGVVYHPAADKLYVATRGEGSWCEHSGSRQRLHVSAVRDLGAARLVSSLSNRGPQTEQIRHALGVLSDRPCGSVGLKIALIAEGSCDLYVNPGERSKLWDLAAPEIILTEAGGEVTDTRNVPVNYARDDLANRHGIVATNGLLHASAIEHLLPLFGPQF